MGILFLLGVASIIQLFFISPAVDQIYEDGIRDLIVMTEAKEEANNDNFKYWASNYYDDSPLQLFEFWLYNCTNPEATANGDIPQFDLIGPWTYRRLENMDWI